MSDVDTPKFVQHFTLVLLCTGGADIRAAITEAKQISCDTGMAIKFALHGVEVDVNPATEIETALLSYYTGLERGYDNAPRASLWVRLERAWRVLCE